MKRQTKARQLLESAVSNFYGGRSDLAGELCEKVLKIDRKNPTALYLLGVVSHQSGEPERAARLVEKSLKAEPKNPDAQNYLGIVLAELNRYEEAAKRFQRAVSLNPEFTEAYNNLGNALKELGKFEDAISSYSAAIRLRPDYAEAFNGLGTAYQELGHDEAETALRRAIELDSSHPEAHLNLGNVVRDCGRYYEAADLYRQTLALDPALSDAYEYLMEALQALSKPMEALEISRQWTKVEPGSPRALWALAESLAATEAYEEAAAAYEEALRASDDLMLQAKILTDISQLPGKLQKPEHLTSLEALMERAPELERAEPSVDFESHLAMGRAAMLHRLGRAEEAWRGCVVANARLDAKYKENWMWEKSMQREVLKNALLWRDSRRRKQAVDESLPVSLLILGPSRSGKSTVEKLAVTLESVSSGFENSLISETVGRIAERRPSSFTDSLYELGTSERDKFIREYGEGIRPMAGENRVVSNTHPYYIMETGWIAELVPNARFIFVERDREDNALRIFMKVYKAGTNFYAYDLAKIHDYLDWYAAMFDAWEGGLAEQVMRIRYEDAISQPSEIRKKIAKLCGIAERGSDIPELGDDRGVVKPYVQFMAEAVSAQ